MTQYDLSMCWIVLVYPEMIGYFGYDEDDAGCFLWLDDEWPNKIEEVNV